METLLTQAHPLRNLEIWATSFPKPSQHYMIQLFETTPSITSLSLTFGALDGEDIVQAAARLPNLQYLSLDLRGDPIRTAPAPGFHSLDTLDTSSKYASALAVARAITSPTITTLIMRVFGYLIEQPSDLFQSMATMTSLNYICLIFYNHGTLQWADVEPILSCPFISSFEIAVNSAGMEIDDEILSAISRAWPNLTRLKLDGLDDIRQLLARPSLHGLAELLLRCQKLEAVTLEVDARLRQLPPGLANAISTSSEPRKKLLLNVRASPIARKGEEVVSEYLMSVWHGECEVVSLWDDHNWQRATWKKVGELMQQKG
ncbi:hypothetical protein FRC01_004044 [Tulasnella sp. 417]|nr:hypothetical protein FRC01_004044 [Tulasnella sp. 417]